MQYRQLGASGLEVSVLSFGAWQLGDPAYWGHGTDEDGAAAVHAALDLGINLFDTAEGYGNGESETALGKALGSKRRQVFVASKVSADHCAPARLRRSCEDSLRRLKTDVIDLYQVHWPFRDVAFQEAYAALAQLKQEGKIREIGVSNFGKQDLEGWMEHGDCVSDQLAYSLLFRAIEYEIVPACQRHGVGILTYMPLMQGLLAGRWQSAEDVPPNRRRTRHFAPARAEVRHDEPGCESLVFDALHRIRAAAEDVGAPMATVAIGWVMAQPGVSSVIVGARDPKQVERNAEAADRALPEEVLAQLNEIADPIKTALGPNPDLWQTGDDARIR